MPSFGPIRRTDLIRYLRQLGFDGPFPGGKHQYMEGRGTRIRIPNQIAATFAENYSPKYYAKVASREMSGSHSEYTLGLRGSGVLTMMEATVTNFDLEAHQWHHLLRPHPSRN